MKLFKILFKKKRKRKKRLSAIEKYGTIENYNKKHGTDFYDWGGYDNKRWGG